MNKAIGNSFYSLASFSQNYYTDKTIAITLYLGRKRSLAIYTHSTPRLMFTLLLPSDFTISQYLHLFTKKGLPLPSFLNFLSQTGSLQENLTSFSSRDQKVQTLKPVCSLLCLFLVFLS